MGPKMDLEEISRRREKVLNGVEVEIESEGNHSDQLGRGKKHKYTEPFVSQR
jgi:hypothetical protein